MTDVPVTPERAEGGTGPAAPRAAAPGQRPPLAARALDTSPEHPWPVRVLASKISEYVDRMSPVWIEGQVVELNRRSGMSFFTLRDTDADMSLSVTAMPRLMAAIATPLETGAHVVVHAKPSFWPKRGTLTMQARDIRAVGIGDLLARIEQLRRVLAAEGLFDADRKRPLPFLPHRIGLVCGREAKAKHDVVVNARDRYPDVEFEIREVAVQGVSAVAEVSRAIADLDADPRVDVIVVTRGGGAVEDLLPFSNEALVRAVAACRTPLVSAIGHETDTPLLDLVADYRASTPTDAAKRIVPDVAGERANLTQVRSRMRRAVEHRVRTEQDRLDALRTRPVLAQPLVLVTSREERLHRDLATARRVFGHRLEHARADVAGLAQAVRTLSPQSTLDRGYAVLRSDEGTVVRDPADVTAAQELEALVAGGTFGVVVR
ncbi:exodeoxyribonuclease VII, large subunit [Beutenbergia cavernae DSM 12333]|uniref:Exodeoxyribonuclease 7 large subunit n=1 Tax=Beutenbergia cavernae (strain ATCC BAA-8 / DSM 12333 / CCUG 43141 / JCM 11478 / NBRC 16432 / NCIMB 13614 / HKI 0122) TaxID=471853 RepID=C5C0V7_BEUC1|nr:exodeoxyribonuclease VII large subunit [Beutenbergia cavernae]ACQ79361.1 exodeoxyribonuclease VII, large subunit [Beutenbergia cavernae DSM 12333]